MKEAGKRLSWEVQKAHINWAPTVCQALCLSFNPRNDIVIQGLQTRKRRPRDVNSFALVIQWIGGRAVPKICTLDTDPGQMGGRGAVGPKVPEVPILWNKAHSPQFRTFHEAGGWQACVNLRGISVQSWGHHVSHDSGTPMYCDAKKLTWLFALNI